MDWEAFYNRFREPNFIPGYEIQNRLGGGAFGEVYKARKHSIGKAYAIKFLKIDDEGQRDAVERELEAVRHFAVIDHPNLVSIEDLGSVLGVPYLIMGYAGEDTLARRLKQGPLEPREALSYFVQTCRGVLALHDRRLVHFDLKPSNVFLKGDVARVGDYGLSKMMADGHSTLSFGRGTPHYMAPEMLRNRADHRADVYSLGVILFESFARRLPYPASVPGTISIRENDDPPLFPPEFPAALRRVVERCLRLSPADRYADVGELLADLGQTARPGDSVIGLRESAPATTVTRERSHDGATRARGDDGAPRARGDDGASRPARAGGGEAASDATPVTPTSDARLAARELTRGALEVARGMWDGLVTGPVQRTRGEEPATPLAPRSAHSTPPRLPPSTSAASSDSSRPSDDVVALHTLSGGGDAPRDGARAQGTAAWLAGTHGSGAHAADPGGLGFPGTFAAAPGTIPVPPPVQGGWFGASFSTLALSLEVLLTLVRATLGAAWRFVLHGRARAPAARGGFWRRSGRFLVRCFRFGLLVAMLVVVGLLATALSFKLFLGAGRGS